MSIPPRRSILTILFMSAWLGGWYFGATSALRELRTGPKDNGFLMFWLAAWTIGGAGAVLSLLWMLFGREVVDLTPDRIVCRRAILGVGRARVYDISNVKNLRLAPMLPRPGFAGLFDRSSARDDAGRLGEFFGASGGAIAFDYGLKTVRFGAGLDEPEARAVISQLQNRNARLRPASAA